MNECVLNAKEIMCIAANLGATELYGIPDGFNGVSKASLSKEVMKVQSSLESKGYLTEDFDGNSSLEDRVVALVAVCAGCEKFIAIDKQVKKQEQEGILFYVKGTDVVKAIKKGEEYALEKFDASYLSEEIKKILEWKQSTDNDLIECIIPNKVLEKAKILKKRNADDAGKEELVNNGVKGNVATVILNGLNGEETFYSFTFADLKAESDNVKNVMFINSDIKSLKLKALMIDEKDVVQFTDVNYENALLELLGLVNELSITGEVFE